MQPVSIIQRILYLEDVVKSSQVKFKGGRASASFGAPAGLRIGRARLGATERSRAHGSMVHGPSWFARCNEGLLIWIPSTHDTQKTELHRANVNVISVFTHLRFLTAALLEREVSAASAVTVVRNAPSLARMIAHPAFRIPNSPPLTAPPALLKALTFPSRCCRLSRSISRLSQ